MATLEQMTNTLVETVWDAIAHFHNVMPDDISQEEGVQFLTEEMNISPEEAWMRLQMEMDIPPWCELTGNRRNDFGEFFWQTILPVLIGMSKHIVEFHHQEHSHLDAPSRDTPERN